MKQNFPIQSVQNPLAVLRKAGYSHFIDPKTQEESFILRLSGDFYPRFHLYVEQHKDTWSFNLHIDQKKPSYSGTSKHAGEYDGPTVERELTRITKWVAAETGYIHPSLQVDAKSHASGQSKTQQEATEITPNETLEDDSLFGGIF